MPYFMIDRYYFLLVIPAMLIAIWAQFKVKSTYSRYSGVSASQGLTAAVIARAILDLNGLRTVTIEHVSGELTDHFDPRSNIVRLSDSVYNSTSIAAIGVAAHECGHAVQYAKGYFPMKIRSTVIPLSNFGSTLGIPLAIMGIFMGIDILVNIGIILFLFVVVLQLITLPVEFNASRRAITTLRDNNMLTNDELHGAKKVLTAAALTYVAAFIGAVANLLRLLMLRDRNN